MAFKSSLSEIECQAAVELTILLAVAEIVGPQRFDSAHSTGLGLWNRSEAELRGELIRGHNQDAAHCAAVLKLNIAPGVESDVGGRCWPG